jgi:hypothetical protein
VANEEEAARWRVTQANQQAARSYHEPIASIREQTAAVWELMRAQISAANAAGRTKGLSARENYYSLLQQAEQAAKAGGGGPSVAQQRFAREAEWERERVTNAKRAALEIKYWEQDQYEWIADNAAGLTAEMQAEFSARTAAAKAEADQVKETDAGLAQELLDAEAQYQQDKASIATDESLTEEERAAKMAILERENSERVERAKETAALEAQIREEERQREIENMRAAGAAGGQAFVEEIQKAQQQMETEDLNRQKRMLAAQENAKKAYGQVFDEAIADAEELWGLVTNILGAADGYTAGQGTGTAAEKAGGRAGIKPGYASGGTVPGPIGQPQIAVVHGGEVITPPGQGNNGVTVMVTGPVYASTPAEAQRAGEDMGRGLRMAAKSGGISI